MLYTINPFHIDFFQHMFLKNISLACQTEDIVLQINEFFVTHFNRYRPMTMFGG